jgi:CheY-like chemotaxis protein
LVKQVLSFARGVEGQRVAVDPTHILQDIQKIAIDTFPKSIVVNLGSMKGLWNVMGDATQMHQVFLNLCINARDAMPDGGHLTIIAKNTTVDKTYAAMNPEAQAGPYVVVSVTDTGMGIPQEVRNKIFEPFFTTKEIGKGTGLGLSTTIGIIKSHGGFINLQSEVRKGTTFEIFLPANPDAACEEKGESELTRLPRGNGETILLVDDEEAIRKIAQSTLESFGYRVVLASHGAEAVSLYAQNQKDIAVVLTDMAMPIMDGPSLIIALKTMNPDIKIISSSGFTSTDGTARAVAAGVRHFIPKPYTAESMLKTLHETLHGESHGS